MNFKNLFVSVRRSAAVREERRASGAGTIVFLMLALVFAPILLANAAVMVHAQLKAGNSPAFMATSFFGGGAIGTN